MLEILYFKKKFFSQFKLDQIINTNEEKSAIKALFKDYSMIYNNIINCDSKIELKNNLFNLYNLFCDIEAEHIKKSGEVQPTGIYYELLYLCQESPLHNIDSWLKKTENSFKKEQKQKKTLFKKFISFLSISEKLPQQYFPQLLSSDNEVITLSQRLIKKYNLSHINLENCKNAKQAIVFLENFDKKTNNLVNDIKISNSYIGLYQTVSIMYTNNKNLKAGYCSQSKCIRFTEQGLNKRSILHEWVHAIDNYVCEKYTNENTFVTKMNKTLVTDNNTPISIAYHTIRELTQKLFNQNHIEVKEYINQTKENCVQLFWEILSIDTLKKSLSNKDFLLHQDNQKKVINYIIEPKNTEYESDIKNLLIQKDCTQDEAQILLENNYYFIKKLKEMLKNSNLNLITEPSNYFKNASKFNKLDLFQEVSKGYYSEPYEMLARYFESQVYNISTVIEDMTSLTSRYTTKDNEFDSIKNKLINNLFPPKKLDITNEIKNIRDKILIDEKLPLNSSENHISTKKS